MQPYGGGDIPKLPSREMMRQACFTILDELVASLTHSPRCHCHKPNDMKDGLHES